MKRRTLSIGLAFALASAPILTFPSFAAAAEKTVVVGLNSAISVTDPHFLISQRDANFWPHVFETLFAVGEDFTPRPQLAKSYSVSEDGLTFTFDLRTDVVFHNGETMTSADVLASWERFKRISPRALNLGTVASMSAPDAATFVVTLSEPQPNFVDQITGTAGPIAILPAADGDKERGEISMIGTGPFTFVENLPDDRTVIAKFDDYSADMSASTDLDGYAGQRHAMVDKVIFRAIPEAGTRISALQSDELTISDNLPVPAAERLTGGEGFVVQDVMPFSKIGISVHSSNPPTDNVLIRRAIQMAIDAEEVDEVALEGFYELEPSFVFANDPAYIKDNVSEYYNQRDAEKAKALLAEAGYNGETIKIMTNTNYTFMQNTALVVSEQLKAIGMNVEIEVVDWSTNLASMRNPEGQWNLIPMGFGVPGGIGALSYWRASAFQYGHPGDDPVYEDLSTRMLNEPDTAKRREIWGEFEKHLAENAYILMMGNRGMKVVSDDTLEGYKPFYSMRFWNVEKSD